jgi:hypothetical protein
MATAVVFMKWEHYQGDECRQGFFVQDPLTFNSRQERLHQLAPGDRLWLVSRCPDDGQYNFVASLFVAERACNPPGNEKAGEFGAFAVVLDRSQSHDLDCGFPAEGLLRAFVFETGQPIRYGASIGQSLQTLRFLDAADERILQVLLETVAAGNSRVQDTIGGLWTKCAGVFADYFLKNWLERREPLAFLLYDPPPALPEGSPVFIHSDENLRLVARFRVAHFVAGHKHTVEAEERQQERERIWVTYRALTTDPPRRKEFNKFWDSQNGVRALFLMDQITSIPEPVPFGEYGRALEWGYPRGVGYRYLSLSQSLLLLRLAALPSDTGESFLQAILDSVRR